MPFPLPKSRNEPQNSPPTFPYGPPILRHVGRYVDSQDTGNMRGGFRVARARTIRIYPSINRLVMQIGNAACLFALDKFFSSRLAAGMVPVGRAANARVTDRAQELVLPWDSFLYPESSASGWTFGSPDQQDPMGKGTPFDMDDRGYLYAGFPVFGWGIAKDDGGTGGKHLPKVVQVTNGTEIPPDSVAAFRVGSRYYAVIAALVSGHAVYDVTDPTSPQLVTKRDDPSFAMRKYDRFDAGQSIAWIDGASRLRIGTYAELAEQGRSRSVSAARGFVDVCFDEAGSVWAAGDSVLARVSPGMIATEYAPFGTSFRQIRALAAGAGYVAVVGTDRTVNPPKFDVRLLRIDGRVPVDTGDFFKNYYHGGNPAFAEPGQYTLPQDLALYAQGGRTYLFYAASGLGDVYEIENAGASPVVVDTPKPPDPPVKPDLEPIRRECRTAAESAISAAETTGDFSGQLAAFMAALNRLKAAAR